MIITVSRFMEPKRDVAPQECEDSACVGDGLPYDETVETTQLRVAISDGASESMLARHWSRMLAERLVRDASDTASRFLRVLREAVVAWPDFVDKYVEDREANNKPIQWYEEPGLARGAYATALSLTLRDDTCDPTWHCVALGDCCLFLCRGGTLVAAYPLTSSDAFNSTPALAASRPVNEAAVAKHIACTAGDFRLGDIFFLATDALSAWLLREQEDGCNPWDTLRDMGTDAAPDFAEWVAVLRHFGRIKDDDTTLVRITTE